MNTNTNVYKLFRFLQKITNTNIEEKISSNPTSFKGSICQYDIEKNLFAIYKELNEEHEDVAYIKGISFLKDLCENVKLTNANADEYYDIGMMLIKASTFIKDFDVWHKDDFAKFKQQLFNIPLIREDEKTDENANKVQKTILSDCQKVVNETKLLNIYSYRNNFDDISKNSGIIFKDTLLITDNINKIISSITNVDDNMIHVYMIMKIEKIIDYSYFIFLIQYKNTVYLATDANTFENPRIKQSTRNPQRRRENVWDKVYLPHGIIDDIIKWRNENNYLSKDSDEIEIYTKKITDYLLFGDKCCIWFLLDSIVNKIIMNQDLPKISFVNEMLPKLIEDKSENLYNDDTFIDINKEDCERYVNSLIIPKTKEIVKVEKSELVKQYVETDWLCTQENFNNLVVWSEKESIRKQKQEILKSYFEGVGENHIINYKNDMNNLKEMISSNIENIAPIIFSGNVVKVKILGYEKNQTFGMYRGEDFMPTLVNHNNEQTFANFAISGDRKGYKHINCKICNERNTSKPMYFFVHHYIEFMLLAGINNRNLLPQSYINYMCYIHIPYCGNQLLDNVNPEFLIQDPLSQAHPNQYSICLHLCKICYNKYLKKYKKFDTSLVILNENGELVDIVDYKEYIKDLNGKIITT